MEKETITGAEMVAIIEGRDPELVDDAYASTRTALGDGFRPSQPDLIEAPAKKVHMISEKIEAPSFEEPAVVPEEVSEEAVSAEETPAEAPLTEEAPAESSPAEDQQK